MFTKNVEFTFSKKSSNGMALPSETQTIETHFVVRNVVISDAEGISQADLFSSFDGVSWQFYGSYEFAPDYTSGIGMLEQAETQIQTLMDA
ncbi:hypothetical protein [Klebsiella pneumoniae]|uniref:hypothetical protein n=1 Tax=Klebsiella pneumoniae TaxID=573 RepID=UPI000E2BCD7D|nr:hypothetical protein [Klebsiella pneumoniae]HCT7446701.1 hypothetical protein [Klebsiella variicola]UAA21295.1 hypothetical protein KZ657_09140 [Klebsiella pneumoniae]SVK95931.1 Uncharacterised protein [Klebsiella pneumoniae]HBQ8679807.1 hypothetical protein [Klebsiella pneumoniae]HBS7744033.1 hypothetical protein [Klebsiella pneumoniae]